MQRIQKEIAAKDPGWAAKIKSPAPLTQAQIHPSATAADERVISPTLAAVPGAAWLTQPGPGFTRRIAIVGGAALALITGGAIVLYRPRRRG